jgi:putative ABC transport system ATP-binding protein
MGDNIVKALDGVDIVVEKGDFVAIMGPSGSGKSTGMNLTGSLDLPSQGKIFLEGHDIQELSESELAQVRGKKIGFIFQSFNLIPNLTAKENVMLPLLFQEIDKNKREAVAEKLLKSVELGDRMDHYPNQLSGGQQQRVAIARALVNSPSILVADEPTGNLDSQNAHAIFKVIKELNESGLTVIIVTHNMDLAKEAKNIIILEDGKIKNN